MPGRVDLHPPYKCVSFWIFLLIVLKHCAVEKRVKQHWFFLVLVSNAKTGLDLHFRLRPVFGDLNKED